MRTILCTLLGRSWGGAKGKVLTIFSGVTDDSFRLRALPEVIFSLDSDFIGHVDRSLPHDIAGAPHCDIVPGLSSLSPPPLDDIAQVGAKGGGGIHGLSRERQTARVGWTGGEPDPPTARALFLLQAPLRSLPSTGQSLSPAESAKTPEFYEPSGTQIFCDKVITRPSQRDSHTCKCIGSESFAFDGTLSYDNDQKKHADVNKIFSKVVKARVLC